MIYREKLTNINAKKILVGLVAIVFITSCFVSLAVAASSIAHASNHCPFMHHSEALCVASTFEHIEEWQSVFVGVLPLLTFLVLIASVILFSVRNFSLLPTLKQDYDLVKTRILLQHVLQTVRTFWYRPLQQFFSLGILHPKLY